MIRNRRTSILSRAAAHALYANKEGEGAAGSDDKPEKLELTPDELEQKLAEAREGAVKEDREKRKQADKEKRARERREQGEEEEEEDPAEIVKKAEARAAEAEQRAADAEKKSLMAEVNVKLRDYLTANFKEFVGNAQDIIMHVERALPRDASEQAIIRLIEAQSKAFVDRTKSARGTTMNPSISRSKITGIPTDQRENKTITRQQEQPERRFSAVNWHG